MSPVSCSPNIESIELLNGINGNELALWEFAGISNLMNPAALPPVCAFVFKTRKVNVKRTKKNNAKKRDISKAQK